MRRLVSRSNYISALSARSVSISAQAPSNPVALYRVLCFCCAKFAEQDPQYRYHFDKINLKKCLRCRNQMSHYLPVGTSFPIESCILTEVDSSLSIFL